LPQQAFRHLVTPLKLRHKTLRNRIVFRAYTRRAIEKLNSPFALMKAHRDELVLRLTKCPPTS